MGINYSPKIVTDGLVLCLDAANPLSYPGSGNTWYDISGNNRHYTIDPTYVSWNTNKYFDVSYAGSVFAFVGPASNTFDFNSDMQHTIFCFMDIGVAYSSSFFYWAATPSVGTDQRAIFTHAPWGNYFFYDVGGCCGGTQRISSSTLGGELTSDGFFCGTWRTRVGTSPVKQFFKNGVSVLSGHTSTATMTWNLTTTAGIASRWSGKISNFIVYNKALDDQEIQQNYTALKGRFGL